MNRRAARRLLGNQRAALGARQREAADPWEQAREAVRAQRGSPSAQLVVDALADSHRKLGRKLRQQPVFCGFGGRGSRREREPGHLEPAERRSGLAERTGRSRRTVIRARRWLEEQQILHCRPGGPAGRELRWLEARRDREGNRGRHYLVGVGGCDKGGEGLANAYWPAGAPEPELGPRAAPPPPPAAAPGLRPPGWERLMTRRRQEELERQRRRAGEHARGP